MNHSEKIDTFAAAFVAAQAQIKGAVKDAVNPHFKNAYADLGSVMLACKDALNNNGISVLQTPAPTEQSGSLALDTVLMHKCGEWVSGTMVIPLGNRVDPQSYGSALTYARRYSLAAMVGVCPTDDDAEGTTDRSPPPRRQAAPPTPTPDAVESATISAKELLEGRGFKADEVRAAIGAAIKSKKKPLAKFNDADWKGFYNAIGAGKFDGFKEINGAPVGAGSAI